MEDRLCWKDLVQKNDNPLNNNLLPNVAINNKQSFDEGNTTINRLNEEILQLKRKTQYVDVKDRQISKLESQVKSLKTENQTKNNEIIELKKQLDTFQDLNLTVDTNELEREIILLKQENKSLKLNSLSKSNSKEEQIVLNIDRIKKLITNKLGFQQNEKVDFILKRYKLKEGNLINKSFLSKIISEIL